MTKLIDARGLSCPQPVILVQDAIKAGELPIEVLVETVTSCENVRRLAMRSGLQVKIEESDDQFKLILEK